MAKKILEGLLGSSTLFCLIAFGFILLSVTPILYHSPTSDNYFMIAHAHLIQEKGFITQDILRMHEGMDFMVPQWLFAMVFTWFYDHCQIIGYKIFGLLIFAINGGTMLWVANILSHNNKKAFVLACACFLCEIILFNGIRPYYVTTTILLLTALLLHQLSIAECKRKKIFYVALLLLSILLVNVHNSLWVSILLVWLCFGAEEIILSIIHKKSTEGLYPILLAACILIIGGLINPYGWEAITYIFTSMKSIQPFMNLIGELRPIFEWKNPIVWIFVVGDFYLFVRNLHKMTISDIFLYVGFLIMGCMSIRNVILFLTIGQFGLYRAMNGATEGSLTKLCTKILTLYLLLFASMFAITDISFPPSIAIYTAVDIIDEYNSKLPSQTTVYSQAMDTGSYLTYRGYKTYIDGCAEIYGIENNKQFDYATEYIESTESFENFTQLLEKYSFDFLIIHTDCKDLLEPYGYELIDIAQSSDRYLPNSLEKVWVYGKK